MQRLQFDVTSPNGVLLFREASKTITCYGEHILTLADIPDDKLYAVKYPLMQREGGRAGGQAPDIKDVCSVFCFCELSSPLLNSVYMYLPFSPC